MMLNVRAVRQLAHQIPPPLYTDTVVPLSYKLVQGTRMEWLSSEIESRVLLLSRLLDHL